MNMQDFIMRILCDDTKNCTIKVDSDYMKKNIISSIRSALHSLGKEYRIVKMSFLEDEVSLQTNLPYELHSDFMKALNSKSQS